MIKMVKCFIILSIIVLIISVVPQRTYALDSVISVGEKFINRDQDKEDPIATEKLQEVSNVVYNIFFIIGIVVAVIIGAILGVQFMIGSLEEQAKIKESLIPYGIGCAVLFTAFTIWKLVTTLLQTM